MADAWRAERLGFLSPVHEGMARGKTLGGAIGDGDLDSFGDLLRELRSWVHGPAHIAKIVPLLNSQQREVRIEAVKALPKLADDAHAESIRNVLNKVKQSDEATIINMADKALMDLDARFSETMVVAAERAEKMAEQTHTLLLDDNELQKVLDEQAKVRTAAASLEQTTVTSKVPEPPQFMPLAPCSIRF